MQYLKLVVLLFSLIFFKASHAEHEIQESDNTTCHEKVLSFADTVAKFTKCSITNARPITFCENCVVDYINSVNEHKDILSSSDVNGTCRSQWIDLDRLQLVESGFHNVIQLWERAHCIKCYDWLDNTSHPNLSNETQRFTKLYTETMFCINKYNKTNFKENTIDEEEINQKLVCIKCKQKYIDINNLYEYIKIKNEDICMDIVDLMNKTRDLWSNNLQCWERGNHPELAFYLSTSFVATLPIFFYFSIKVYNNRNIQLVS
ncbi:osteopetrosis-associated transmembrane protein 1-like [Ctenocephalides felis]|uniref:osteopetrosis-associated transmembrane protein 1-like n=1 Tax=Ctenocephalides felis TaxID=7515 RepID=UPI000E6E1415|nr:osteopetrosis-associated transmembrane protein 1-like [Ctenocephalides felis]XP_026465418.1 osteopetrosis-associated transmembrane protein 1-like [Ctenocephalides felis]